MKISTIFIIFILINLIQSHTYNCIFEQVNSDLRAKAADNTPEISITKPGKHPIGTILTSTSTNSYGSMRIYLQYSNFNSSIATAAVNGVAKTTLQNINFILKTLFVAKYFYEKRLKTGQLSSITIPNYCVDFAPQNSGGQIINAQLLIFARYTTDKSKAYGATGKSCDWISGSLPDETMQIGRPSIGRIIFNTYNLVDQEASLTNRLFQSITTTTIHEVTHMLGFDSTLYGTYLDPSTGNVFSSPTVSASLHASRPSSAFLTTPNVKAWAQNHYNCSTLPGMLLENQDGSGSVGSHWERVAIYDQLMTATSFGAKKGIFGLTYALLKDTGWYQVDDTFSETTNYGYQKGCSFVLDACYSNTSFPQFCNSASLSNVSLCQTTFYGKAVCSSASSAMSDSCGIYVPYFNCVDPTSTDPGYQPYTYEGYATNSFCVKSTLGTVSIPSNLQSRCYPYFCNTSSGSIVFTVGSYSITCLSTEQGVTKTLNALTGSLTCPIFSQFCTVSRKTCPNWCSQNGFCTNGICNCMNGSSNSDCSVTKCTKNPLRYYSLANSSCVTRCPSKTYLNIYSNTCQYCTLPCICNNTPTNCIGCISNSDLQYFYSGACYSVCPKSTYSYGYTCVACNKTANCLTCSANPNFCISCSPGTYFKKNTCVFKCTAPYQFTDMVNKKCVSKCPNYLLLSGSHCIFCQNGTYLFEEVCNSSCPQNDKKRYYADEKLHACIQCSPSCFTCDGLYPQNCTSCKFYSKSPYFFQKMCWQVCPKGFYANPSRNCQPCPVRLNCQSCRYNTTTSSAYCTSCIHGTFYSKITSTCSTTCSDNQYKDIQSNSCNSCHFACLTCNGPEYNQCLSCKGSNLILINKSGGRCLSSCLIGYAQVGNKCQSCDRTCRICSGISADQCLSCKIGYYLYRSYCLFICPSGTFPNSTSQKCQRCQLNCNFFDGTTHQCPKCSRNLYLYNFTQFQMCQDRVKVLQISPNIVGGVFCIIIMLIFFFLCHISQGAFALTIIEGFATSLMS